MDAAALAAAGDLAKIVIEDNNFGFDLPVRQPSGWHSTKAGDNYLCR